MRLLERPLEHPAIYKIENLITGDFYIGSTINAYKRFCHHRTDLRKVIHSSIHLQNAWNKYGEDNFLFYVLEYSIIANRKELYDTEQYYIDTLNPRYNMSRRATGSDWNEEQRKKASLGQLGSKIKNTTKYRDDMSNKMSSMWKDQNYRDKMLLSMRSEATRSLHSKITAKIWSRDGVKEKSKNTRLSTVIQRGHINNGLPVEDVYKLRELYDSGIMPKQLSSLYPNLPYKTLVKIVRRETWKNL